MIGVVAAAVIGVVVGAVLGAAAVRVWTGRHAASASDEKPAVSGAATTHVSEVAAMTAGLAHEIKNPLSTIGMNAQLLDEAIADLAGRGGGDEQELARVRRRIGTLVRETERLRGILSDFLEFAGELRLHTTEADLNEVVGELADFFHPETAKSGVRLRVEPAAGPVRVVADVPHLKQAVLNLMINATQAMTGQEGGPKELILRVAETVRGGVREAELHVIDTGPGMDALQRARVFEPYFTTKSGGTGLGLPTARRIIDAHGGRLELVSEPGRGSDFAVVLPAGAEAGGDGSTGDGAGTVPIRRSRKTAP